MALLLVVPTLWGGWVADDYLQLLAQRPNPGVDGLQSRPLDLFRFADGSSSGARALMEQGVFPWWADQHVRLSFLRPLASLTHAIDAWLWPNSSVVMHAHSLLWYLGLVLAAGHAYRRFSSSTTTALLALALFAVDDAHAPVVGWIANRNALVGISIMLVALLLHARWRRSGGLQSALLAHACFGLGLAGGEAAATALGYFCAHALWLDQGRPLDRLRCLLGYAAVFVVWRMLYGHLGYGVSGSGLYVDPLSHPVGFARLGLPRLLALLQGQFAAPWSDFWELYPLVSSLLQPTLMVLGVLLLSGLLALAWPALCSRPAARFWLCGSLGAILPVCASFPHDRLLLGAGIGGAAFLAEVVHHTVSRPQPRWRSFGASFVLVLHLAVAPALCLLRASTVGTLDDLVRAQQQTLPSAETVRGQTVVLVNPPLDPLAAYLAPYRALHGIPVPGALYWLATGVSELQLTALDTHTLMVRPRGGYLWSESQRMLRDPSKNGDYPPVQLRQARFEVMESTSDGRPAALRVRFERRLDDPTLRFFRWQGHGYTELRLPTIGQTLVVPAVDCWAALRG